MDTAPILIDGVWRVAASESWFQAEDPTTGETLPLHFPVSTWADCDMALAAASRAARELRLLSGERIASFLNMYADNIESAADSITRAAVEETALPLTPRLREIELPRTTDQLRQAAVAACEGSWRHVAIDTERNIRCTFAPIGPVVIFGPNNFPLAFNGVSGGDFASAIAAGNPVIAKAHPLHPNTTRLLAEEARKAEKAANLPPGTVQMIYHVSNENGLRLVSDLRVGAIGFTGSRTAGLALKRAAEDTGRPIYLEMSSLNPVIFFPGSIRERVDDLARELADSCLAAAGQFCTSPNLLLALEGPETEQLIQRTARNFIGCPERPLLSRSVRDKVQQGVRALQDAGADLVIGGHVIDEPGYRHQNTLLRVAASRFIATPSQLQREVFGNATLFVIASSPDEMEQVLWLLQGSLTGSIYSAELDHTDDELYARMEPLLRERTGRLLNDKMPTGVAVSPAMNHGGPYPATSHPGFSAVGIPHAITRFTALQCYEGVRDDRLPHFLRS